MQSRSKARATRGAVARTRSGVVAASVVATGNPGCLLQVLNGLRDRGVGIRVVHPITLLAEAYRRD